MQIMMLIDDFFRMVTIADTNDDHHDNCHNNHDNRHNNHHTNHYNRHNNHDDHLPRPVDEQTGSDKVEQAEESQHHHHRNRI